MPSGWRRNTSSPGSLVSVTCEEPSWDTLDVQTSLARLYGSGLHTSFELNPRLIGGMRIRVGSDVYDASVRARLAALEARL